MKGLRRAKASSCAEARRYLDEVFVAEWNSRWRKEPASADDAHRPLEREQDAASILSRIEERVVGNDYTVSMDGQRYQIPRAVIAPRMRRNRIRVEKRLDGRLMGRWAGGKAFELGLCGERRDEPKQQAKTAGKAKATTPGKAKGRRRGNNGWMDNFSVGDPARERPSKAAAPARTVRPQWRASLPRPCFPSALQLSRTGDFLRRGLRLSKPDREFGR